MLPNFPFNIDVWSDLADTESWSQDQKAKGYLFNWKQLGIFLTPKQAHIRRQNNGITVPFVLSAFAKGDASQRKHTKPSHDKFSSCVFAPVKAVDIVGVLVNTGQEMFYS